MTQPALKPPAADWQRWRAWLAGLGREHSHSQILGGSLLMLVGSTLVSVFNFAYNVVVAQLLGPVGFGHAAAAVTLLMLVSAITLAFQLVCAKFVARNASSGAQAAVYRNLMRRAWGIGLGLGGGLCLASGAVASYLNLPSPMVVVILAAGVAFYVPLGVKRGGYQGVCAFYRLTANFILEVLIKLIMAVWLMKLGFGVDGAVAAITVSVVLSYFFPLTPRELTARPEPGIPASFGEGMQAIVFFVGQVIINNIDILLVKHFFAPAEAGFYAAVALVGRVVYMLGWSVVSAMFPISAGSKRNDDSSVLVVPLLIVLGIGLIFTVGLGMFREVALQAVLGPGFQNPGGGLETLLVLYAAATGAYSLSVVLVAYEMSRKLANSAWIQLTFSGLILAATLLFHHTLHQVVIVRLVLMVLLLIVSALPFFPPHPAARAVETVAAAGSHSLPRLRRVWEEEVIAAFLRNEYHHADYDPDRERFRHVVLSDDYTSASENALRRALLFRRRGTMWRELPPDTQWYEVKLNRQDIGRLRVFPRAQWRRLASGSFGLTEILDRIRRNQFSSRAAGFVGQIREFSEELKRGSNGGAILLIGLDQHQPLTIIEGNHRLTAAALAGETEMLQFRYFCGFSPHMTECCWYQTTLATLYRYARHRLKMIMYDRETDIAQIMQSHLNQYRSRETHWPTPGEDFGGGGPVRTGQERPAQNKQAS